MRVFVDETGWLALMDSTLPEHAQVSEVFADLLSNNARLFTHNIAVANSLDAIRNRFGSVAAKKFGDTIDEAHAGTYLSILWIGRRTQKESLRLFRNHTDLDLHPYDFASFQMMNKRRIHTILTIKQAYSKLGLNVIPEMGETE